VEQSDISFKVLANKYGLKDATIRSRKNRDNWQRNVTTNKSNAPPSREPTITIDAEGLTDKQILFVSYYLKYWNATKAYQKAYGCDYASARVEGSRTLAKPNIKEEVQKARDEIFAESYLSFKTISQA
jgi:phage terminase small subunit